MSYKGLFAYEKTLVRYENINIYIVKHGSDFIRRYFSFVTELFKLIAFQLGKKNNSSMTNMTPEDILDN